MYLKRILFLLLSFVQWLHVGARNPGTRYIMNTKTDTEAPSARTQWIAEPLHREKYFNILPKFLLIFHPCHYSCRSWLSHSLVTVKGSHDQSSEPRQSGATETILSSAETWNSKYYLLCQKILFAFTSESCPRQQREGEQLSTFYFLPENYYNFLNGTATTIFLQLCFVKTAKFVFTARIYNPH